MAQLPRCVARFPQTQLHYFPRRESHQTFHLLAELLFVFFGHASVVSCFVFLCRCLGDAERRCFSRVGQLRHQGVLHDLRETLQLCDALAQHPVLFLQFVCLTIHGQEFLLARLARASRRDVVLASTQRKHFQNVSRTDILCLCIQQPMTTCEIVCGTAIYNKLSSTLKTSKIRHTLFYFNFERNAKIL